MRVEEKKREVDLRSTLRSVRDGDETAIEELVLALRDDERLRDKPLGEAMPELAGAETMIIEARLEARVFNVLRRAGFTRFSDLVAESPLSLLRFPNLGPCGLTDILFAAVRTWVDVLGPSGSGAGREEVMLAARGTGIVRNLAGAMAALEQIPDFDLFVRRKLSDEPPTLRRLGAEIGISGERVRQRENRAAAAIAELMRSDEWPVRAAVDRLQQRIGSLASNEELADALAALDPEWNALKDVPQRVALLLYLAGYRVAGDWVQSAGLDRQTDKALTTITEDGPVSLKDCARELSRLGIREELERPWLESRPGFWVIGERLGRESQIMEVPIAILRAAREPLDLRELFVRAEPPMRFESFRSHIQQDERFTRRGVRHYGLSEWEEDPYTTLAEEMSNEIERNGGAISLNALVYAMTERFDVAEGSVLHRARTPQFEIDATGRISRCIAPLVIPSTPLALTRNCFHLEAGWAMKVKVTPRLLQGATTRMPLAFARALGLQFGTSRTVAGPSGTLRAYWPRYAASAAYLSSLHAVTRELGAHEGDLLFVIHRGKNRLDFKLVGKKRREATTGMARLALECGFEPDGEPARQVLVALGLDPNLPDAKELIRARLNARRERRLAVCIDVDE